MTELWSPSEKRRDAAQISEFIRAVQNEGYNEVSDPHSLYNWSVKEPVSFWKILWSYCGIIASGSINTALKSPKKMPGAQWFPDTRLNFAENLLRFADDQPALVSWAELQDRKEISYRELKELAGRFEAGLRKAKTKTEDRVAAVLPNIPEAVIGMLGATSLGAVWTSCSPDFGASGIVDRFGQTEPKILIVTDGYYYKDKPHLILPKITDALKSLPSVETVVVIPYCSNKPDISELQKTGKKIVLYKDFLSEEGKLSFQQLPFQHPAYILYSSGTTGEPKCIIHSAGGTLLEHLKELVLHTDLRREDRIYYQTTCGWMMWNWLVSSLAVGSTVLLYDGFPLGEDGKVLFRFAAEEKISIFGTNAKFLSAIEKQGLRPKESFDLSALKTILSTGSTLLPESFDYVYRDIKEDVCLSGIAGGTDIVGCFALGCPSLPVHRSELQIRSLGLGVEVWNDNGEPIQGEKGELVCTAPFPSMPVGFWNDPDDKRYKDSYFSHFEGAWRHGDYVELTANQGVIFYGRSDTVLNPGGVRIGTAEIYRQLQKVEEVEEGIVIGQSWEDDVRVVLFVKLGKDILLNSDLEGKIRSTIQAGASPYHVPKKILQVEDIPRTRSGKIVELAVRSVVHDEPLSSIEALSNPEALDFFRNRKELQS